MKDRDYTIEDEKRRLEEFLRKESIIVYYNYVRMEKGPKPSLFSMLSFSYQLRVWLLDFNFLIFSDDYLYILRNERNIGFHRDNMKKIPYSDVQNFSFQKVNRNYCISFYYDEENYYYYLNDSLLSQFLEQILGLKIENYSYENLAYLNDINFKGLL